jgi:hypothetical protein
MLLEDSKINAYHPKKDEKEHRVRPRMLATQVPLRRNPLPVTTYQRATPAVRECASLVREPATLIFWEKAEYFCHRRTALPVLSKKKPTKAS